MDKWNIRQQSFWDCLTNTQPDPGHPEFIGPGTMEDHFNKKGLLNPFPSTKLDDYLILFAVIYGVYIYNK